MINRIHSILTEWANWRTTEEEDMRCEIGWSRQTIEGKMAAGIPIGTGNKAKRVGRSIVPTRLITNAKIAHLNRVVEELPASLLLVIKAKYCGEGTDSERVRAYVIKHNSSYATFMRRLHDAHIWLVRRGI